ncbi:glycosyltransferase family 1 protein [Sinorhizobium meliloti]|uniref:Glycosyltransferase n=2 Tax=Rhizobium meliloti TaxID=382 RepID=Q92VP4_RHIME|nr:glycosyltransferase family 1 protein [Sinorhizobium meliloti]AGA11027.1 Glycosyltransferase [Sinorhizobium meliloti GR4]AGG71671.1 Putative glycosyltransferase [Sinorhizobium meliloti 2011]ASP62220.1 glycosyltransferase family 1 protein [Sinorhizobium meliloti]MCK3804874.1 glycosyltransferase family 4 protein [Sinorhizobium meliloti]MCK3810881.1 glycosyltransferase family 4 protein [Sinorhizobium meliloti]
MERSWTINGRFLAQPLTGVQRYAFEIVRALDELIVNQPLLASRLKIELLVPRDAKVPSLRAISTRAIAIAPMHGHLWEQAALAAHVRGGLLSFCNTGPLSVRKQILCIHDVNTRTYPQSYSLPFRLLYRTLLPALGRRVAAVATVSRYSAGELVRHRICGPDKITVIPNGHEHAASWKPRHSQRTRAVAGRDTIVVIGSAIAHKNTGLIIGMAERLAAVGLRIAVVGMSDARVYRTSGRKESASNVTWLGRLSDEELAALLQDCLCLAFPSFIEGFGLPPLEAMAIGCPIVVSNRASLPEICGEAALYASPNDAEAWFDRFMRVRNMPDVRDEMIGIGRMQASNFQWKASASRYLDIMAVLDGMSKPSGGPVAVSIA